MRLNSKLFHLLRFLQQLLQHTYQGLYLVTNLLSARRQSYCIKTRIKIQNQKNQQSK